MRANAARRALRHFSNSVLAGLVSAACLLAGAPRTASAQAGGPLPYAPIANPLPDTMDQLYRDSLNIKFSKIRVNQAGYRTTDRKFFYTVGATGTTFKVIDEGKAQVATGTLTATGQSTSGQLSIKASNNASLVSGGDTRYTMIGPIFSGPVSEGEIPTSIAPGKYRIVVGTDTSAPFMVDNRIYSWVKDALLKFYGVNRDGNTDSWFHPASHMKDGPNGDGSLTGGWFDCGDHLKESQTMGYAMAMLGLYSATLPDRDADHYGRNQNDTYRTDGVPDMLYETKIGADYFLKSYDLAKGDPSKMITSIGSFGGDHGWWGRPEFQDGLPHDRGGPVRDVRVEVGANVTGKIAAGLAFFSRQYSPFDKDYSDRCLAAAKKIYAYGKTNLTITNSSAYNGDASYRDDLALAAVALLWATKDTTYKNDLIANATLGTYANTNYYVQGTFAAGWLADSGQGYLNRGGANTCWASLQMPTLWAFYRLILKDSAQAATYGITSQRLDLIEDVAFGYIANLGWMQGGTSTITLPASNPQLYGGNILTYDPLWKINTHIGANATPVYNRYIAGNSSDIFCYYDMAKDLQGKALPHTPASMDWKADEVHQLLVRQMDYMLGVNPWDISMIYGVGAKNFNHPHHRGANPEGSNLPGAFYHYRPPVGALQGGYPAAGQNGSGLYYEFWGDYDHSESCLDGTTSMLLPALGLANDEAADPLAVQVQIEYVGTDHAIIIVRQSRFGTALIRYGTSATALNTTKAGDSAGMEHRIVLSGLTPGTTYYFQAEAVDIKGGSGLNDNGGSKFVFTTLAQPPGAAQIAQVKVCNVTDKTAEILWYTPNGAYDSKVVYGTGKPPTQVHDGDITDDNQGQFYTFTTKIQHVEFDVRAISYPLDGKTYLGFNIVNQDIKSYDSLDVRLYMRATVDQMADFGVRADIGQAYLSTGYLDPTNAFKTGLDTLIQRVKPVRMDETFDAATNTYFWYVSLPMGNAVMASGARFRVDVTFVKRNEHNDLLDQPSTYVPSSKDWSWAPHSRAQGDPVDFGGIKTGTKDDVDTKYIFTEVDPYITVYRKGQFVWGYSPSSKEQATKVTNYQMNVQITAPLNNPPEDYKKLDQASSTAIVKGTVTISDAGKLTDVWVNGERVANVSQVATYDAKANAWNLNVPIKLKPGPNEVDITLFGGADPNCQGCVGCAFVNRHF
ncbi:MAG: glycoside hydrolase family 9 protein [Fibrobacteres bacterium]|nr:glycoside hydrolase family 9 protein [Fibrobacterota bacterium]